MRYMHTMAQTNELDLSTVVRGFKYKIEQTAKGARITVHGDDMTSVVNDYFELRQRLETAGFRIAPED
jgi:hypothetical protein